MSDNLQYRRVLVVEDEVFVALDVAATIEDALGTVIGPVGTVRQALKLIDENNLDAAILDVNLIDGDIGLVLERLAAQDVFVVIHTGGGLPAPLAKRFPNMPIFYKPTAPSVLTHALAEALQAA